MTKTSKPNPFAGSFVNFLLIGAHLQPWETLLMFSSSSTVLVLLYHLQHPLWFFFLSNFMFQMALFIPIVNIPTFLTSKMSYVDLGWPAGLVLLAGTCFHMGTGFPLRKLLICTCLFLHGSRMSLGGIIQFFPYTFPTGDLPRYQYAKRKWLQYQNMPLSLYWLKMQQDVMQQCFANAVGLAAPIALQVFNDSTTLHPMEIMGYMGWLICWGFESAADLQKKQFIQACAQQKPNKQAVLGFTRIEGAPSDWLWRLCRHPNYFFEWMCWNCLILSAVPSLFKVHFSDSITITFGVKCMFAIMFVCTSRFFYDCLVYWTGAGPAEHFSEKKRPDYRKYQRQTNVFWPVNVPYFDHHRESGWSSHGMIDK